ncbi:TRAFAC clade GTPase domain-containing protein [Burkholderia ambifaria]|uniref:TRAFAC clade GTPase domain-containing protein n=1 Tax=Burkholderia ambifaria TaxID=152480 RepID=UPI001588C2C4|nr:hypothetical protein [Burkholderia ambifaria]
MNPRRCANPHCHVDEGETCVFGELSYEQCAVWKANAGAESEPSTVLSTLEARVPWSGSALGPDDLTLLLPRAPHILVGVLGAHDVGKTTLLTTNYLLLLTGRKIAGASFAGSRTLGAWEALASWMRFHDSAKAPMFPPHTSRAAGRTPGLLHAALRGIDGSFRDVLLTDAPGEWFTAWAVNEGGPQAEGARWVAEHSDCFLLVADCQRLSGEQRGIARKGLLQLIERLSNHAKGRPVTLVWTKSEFSVPDGIRSAIQNGLSENIPGAIERSATIKDPETLAEVVDDLVARAWQSPRMDSVVPAPQIDSPFFAYRGQHGDT